MSKAVLVMDMPSSCRKCDLRVIGIDNFCVGADCRKIDQMEIINEDIKPDWCPLRELPKKKIPQKFNPYEMLMLEHNQGYRKGYNACIDELLKGEEG